MTHDADKANASLKKTFDKANKQFVSLVRKQEQLLRGESCYTLEILDAKFVSLWDYILRLISLFTCGSQNHFNLLLKDLKDLIGIVL